MKLNAELKELSAYLKNMRLNPQSEYLGRDEMLHKAEDIVERFRRVRLDLTVAKGYADKSTLV